MWVYLLDNCDNTGVWIADFETLSCHVGFKVTEANLISWLGEKLVKFEGDKFFIPSFATFQYGENLNPENKAHRPVIKVLAKLSDLKPLGRTFEGPLRAYQDKEKDKDMDKDKEKEQKFDFESLCKDYPRHEGKGEGIKRLKTQIKTQLDYDNFAQAIRNYVQRCEQLETEIKFIKHFSSFVGTQQSQPWKDWVNPKPLPSPTKTINRDIVPE